jgi:hypothetical protein
MARTTAINLSPVGDAIGTVLVLVAVLLAEVALDRLLAPGPIAPPAVDVGECLDVCQGWVSRYSTTECVCKFEGS